jgi:hypothetical protein
VRYPEEDTPRDRRGFVQHGCRYSFGASEQDRKRFHASEVDDINQLPRCVTVERASLQKTSTTGRRSLLPAEIDLHHDRFLAEVIAPFDDLPAKFAVEPFG